MNDEYQPVSFAPGDVVPVWALNQVGDHVLEPEDGAKPDGDAADADDAEDPADHADTDADGVEAQASDDQPDFTAPAPRRNSRARK
jgi:hypothetical protein